MWPSRPTAPPSSALAVPSRTLQNTRTSDGVSSQPTSVTAPSRHEDGCICIAIREKKITRTVRKTRRGLGRVHNIYIVYLSRVCCGPRCLRCGGDRRVAACAIFFLSWNFYRLIKKKKIQIFHIIYVILTLSIFLNCHFSILTKYNLRFYWLLYNNTAGGRRYVYTSFIQFTDYTFLKTILIPPWHLGTVYCQLILIIITLWMC